jgi:hypothetical protein
MIHNVPFVFYVSFAFSFFLHLKSFVNAACILLNQFLQLQDHACFILFVLL